MLVTVVRYQAITGDTSTAASAVSALVEDATALAEEDLRRPLEQAERTETMWPDRCGWLWPLAVPLVDGGDYTIDGDGLKPGVTGAVPYFPEPTASRAITYTGGFLERSANPSASNRLPAHIERDLAWAAYALGHGDELLAGLPTGASSVSVGDLSVSFEAGAAAQSATDVRIRWSRATMRHKRRTTY